MRSLWWLWFSSETSFCLWQNLSRSFLFTTFWICSGTTGLSIRLKRNEVQFHRVCRNSTGKLSVRYINGMRKNNICSAYKAKIFKPSQQRMLRCSIYCELQLQLSGLRKAFALHPSESAIPPRTTECLQFFPPCFGLCWTEIAFWGWLSGLGLMFMKWQLLRKGEVWILETIFQDVQFILKYSFNHML